MEDGSAVEPTEIVLTYADGSVAKRNLAMQRRYSCVACMKCFQPVDVHFESSMNKPSGLNACGSVGDAFEKNGGRWAGSGKWEVAQVPDSLDPSSSLDAEMQKRPAAPSKAKRY